jgi:hypothetical protein
MALRTAHKKTCKISVQDNVWIIFIGTSRIDEIWTRSTWLHLDDKSSHEKKFGISNSLVSWFASIIWFESIWILTLAYLELD